MLPLHVGRDVLEAHGISDRQPVEVLRRRAFRVPLDEQVKGAKPRLLGDGSVRAHGVVGRARHAQQQARARGQVERLA